MAYGVQLRCALRRISQPPSTSIAYACRLNVHSKMPPKRLLYDSLGFIGFRVWGRGFGAELFLTANSTGTNAIGSKS